MKKHSNFDEDSNVLDGVTGKEYRFILRRMPISVTEFGRKVAKLLGRAYAYSPDTVYKWMKPNHASYVGEDNGAFVGLTYVNFLREIVGNENFITLRREFQKLEQVKNQIDNLKTEQVPEND